MYSLLKFSSRVNNSCVNVLKDGWDWPLSDAESLEAFVDKHRSSGKPFVCYWVIRDSTLVGLLEFSQYTEHDYGKMIDIGLFIHKEYRGEGIADMLLHSAVEALDKMNLPCIATVSVENLRSLGLIRKATGLHGVEMLEPARGRNAFVFDFSKESFDTSGSDAHIVNAIVVDSDVKEMFEKFV